MNTETESPRKVEINRGLRYVEVSCDIVDRSRVIDPLLVISTLLVTTYGSLKGTVVHYKDIECRVPIRKGAFYCIQFNVHE